MKTVILFNLKEIDNAESKLLRARILELFKITSLSMTHGISEIIINSTGLDNDFADFWSVFFKLKKEAIVKANLLYEFSWINKNHENLLTDFFET